MMGDEDTSFDRLSPTLAVAFLSCSASAAWTLEARRGLRAPAERGENPQAELIIRKGHEHETASLAALRERCGDFVEVPSGALEARFAATVEAMSRGVPLIYQAALTAGAWLVYADFLVRIETAARDGAGLTSRGTRSCREAREPSICSKSPSMATCSRACRGARRLGAR